VQLIEAHRAAAFHPDETPEARPEAYAGGGDA
jgi:hypothetical protein